MKQLLIPVFLRLGTYLHVSKQPITEPGIYFSIKTWPSNTSGLLNNIRQTLADCFANDDAPVGPIRGRVYDLRSCPTELFLKVVEATKPSNLYTMFERDALITCGINPLVFEPNGQFWYVGGHMLIGQDCKPHRIYDVHGLTPEFYQLAQLFGEDA